MPTYSSFNRICTFRGKLRDGEGHFQLLKTSLGAVKHSRD